MTRKEIIDRLKFTVEMFLFDPSTGEKITEPRNDMDKTTIDACRGAIELLEQEPILDEIRNDIMKLQTYKMFEGEDTVYVEWDDVLRIIDKYREIEVKNEDSN